MLKNLLLPILFLFISSLVSAQIQITNPINRSVYQRVNGQSVITVTGTFTQYADRIEALFTYASPDERAGQSLGWQTVQVNPRGGFFNGKLNIPEGWFTLQVRGTLNGQQVSIAQVDRVGVGEVFLIAGQSNSQGYYRDDTGKLWGVQGASDDRVNCVSNFANFRSLGKGNFNTTDDSNVDFPKPIFSKLDAETEIAPRGYGSWYWGILGDLLANRLKVPILFFNVGWYGTSSKNWYESALGQRTKSEFIEELFPAGMPYKNMKSVLNYYNSQYGLRSVLWMQGESDNFKSVSTNDYIRNLRTVIEKSKEDFGKDITWVISQSSYYESGNVRRDWVPVIDAQQLIPFQVENLYAGPYTDGINGPTLRDGIHYIGDGLKQVAQLWDSRLDDNFFRNSKPILPDTIPAIAFDCKDDNVATLRLPTGYKSYEWSNGANGSQIEATASSVSARLTTNSGNTVLVPAVNITPTSNPVAPTILPNRNVIICEGSAVNLVANGSGVTYQWSTNESASSIIVNKAGFYTTKTTNQNGCVSALSPAVEVIARSIPPQPTILVNDSRSLSFCEGGEVRLSTNATGAPVLWNTGETTPSITVKKTGTYTTRTFGQNGCDSQESQGVNVTVNPFPVAPQLLALSDTVFCEGTGGVDLLVQNPSNLPIVWTNPVGANALQLNFRKPGQHSVYVVSPEGCRSNSNIIFVGARTTPQPGVIKQTGPYTLEATNILTANDHIWKLWNVELSSREKIIKVNQEGPYTVLARNIYQTPRGSLVCQAASASSLFVYNIPTDNKNVIVYPNPSNDGIFSVELFNDLESVFVKIYTIQGQLLYETVTDFVKTKRQLDVSQLGEGSFILKMEAGTQTFTVPIRVGR
jgi:hypothetical protein